MTPTSFRGGRFLHSVFTPVSMTRRLAQAQSRATQRQEHAACGLGFKFGEDPKPLPTSQVPGFAGAPLPEGVPTEEAYVASYCARVGREVLRPGT